VKRGYPSNFLPLRPASRGGFAEVRIFPAQFSLLQFSVFSPLQFPGFFRKTRALCLTIGKA
jgi:hypothetical protein